MRVAVMGNSSHKQAWRWAAQLAFVAMLISTLVGPAHLLSHRHASATDATPWVESVATACSVCQAIQGHKTTLGDNPLGPLATIRTEWVPARPTRSSLSTAWLVRHASRAPPSPPTAVI